jgi:hypothetical protein
MRICAARSAFLVGGQGFTHAHEGANDKDAHFDGAFGVQHRRGHDGAVFGKRIGQVAAPTVPGI